MIRYLFFDESGNLDFSPKGSRYFFFGLLGTWNPAALTWGLTELRYQLLADGLDLECFHATDDRQPVRSQVFAALGRLGGFELDFLVVDKDAVPDPERDPMTFYPRFATVLLESVLARHTGAERTVLVTDRLPLQSKRKAHEKAFRTSLRDVLGERPFTIVHQGSAAHAGLQAVDYCTWALQRKWRDDDARSYRLVERWVVTVSVAQAEAGV
jgi:hypothetical protein